MSMLKLAMQAQLPLIHITTDDIINVEEVLTYVAGKPAKPLQLPEVINKVTDLKFPEGPLFYTSSECKSLAKLYNACVNEEKTIVFVNTDKSVLQFDGQALYPPQEMVQAFLKDIVDEDSIAKELLPSFGGLTLKDVGEVAKLTMTRDGSLKAEGVNETRRGYAGKLRGIEQINTHLDFYICPTKLKNWLKANSKFFLQPLHPSLIPRGMLFDGPPGCLSGDTLVEYRRGKRNSGRSIRLESLYRRFNGLPDGKNPPRIDAPTYLHSMREDGSLFYNRVLSVTEAGVKPCVTINTAGGRCLTLTNDHPICLDSGEFIPPSDLGVGAQIRVKASMMPLGTGGKKKRIVHRREICVKQHPIAGEKIVDGYIYKRLHFARVMVEAHMNGMSLYSYVKRLNSTQSLDGLKFLPRNHEVHHLDENIRNDALSNLVVMPKAEHARYHPKVENFNTDYVGTDTVTSISSAGKVMTYDVEMEMPCHNFAANEFIVHNTGKTLGAKAIASAFGVPAYRLDLGAMMGKYVGESEGNLVAALAQIDQVEPCVVLFDEVEKVFQSTGDSGVTSRLLSQLLWWLQEHKSKVFSVMTTNKLKAIPEELYREGRIDETMYFMGIESVAEGQTFVTQALAVLAKEIGYAVVPEDEKILAVKVKALFKDNSAVPQAKLTQLVFSMLKEFSVKGGD